MKEGKRSIYKELKQPDEFETFWTRVVGFVQEHRREVLLGAAGVVLLVVAVSVGAAYMQSRERKAAALFDAARASVEAALGSDALPRDGTAQAGEGAVEARELPGVSELKEIARRYGRTPGGWQSRLLLGQVYFEKGLYDDALDAYEALAHRRGVPPEMRALAWEGLAYVHEERAEFDRAASYYEKVAKGPVAYLQAWSWFGLARCREQMGDPAGALDAYSRFLADAPNHPLAPEARALASRIQAPGSTGSAEPGAGAEAGPLEDGAPPGAEE